eukprot:TRINITY_DN1872_c0_g1_i1.p1 TRINITY_DN1872_c0_g1~~TRINITY_DN1872_c0_g1_i1.p1  ORF type:complete len:223 (+),score=43.64 TRINITY_DN1872_c0_g1_i1:66-671(+)
MLRPDYKGYEWTLAQLKEEDAKAAAESEEKRETSRFGRATLLSSRKSKASSECNTTTPRGSQLPSVPETGGYSKDNPDVLELLLREIARRNPDQPYPDARSVVAKLAWSFRYSVSGSWDRGLKTMLLISFKSDDATEVLETLKIVERWLIPAPPQATLNSSAQQAVVGFMELEGAAQILSETFQTLVKNGRSSETAKAHRG